MSFERRTYLLATAGVLLAFAIATPSSLLGWAVFALLALGQMTWVADRIRAHAARAAEFEAEVAAVSSERDSGRVPEGLR